MRDTTSFLASLPEALNLRGENSASRADVVAAIRRDLKLAVEAGLIPKDVTFSVTKRDYNSITVELIEWYGQVLTDAYFEHHMSTLLSTFMKDAVAVAFTPERCARTRRMSNDPRLVEAVNDVLSLVEQISDRHNFDESDPMTDYFHVGYYLNVGARRVITAAELGIQMECDPAWAEMVQRGRDAAKRLGAKVVKSVCGNGGVDGCGQWSLERLLKLDEMAAGRPLTYDKRRRNWVVAS